MKLSIITINRNNAEGLRKTIESVVSQTFTDYEYIIIDGASTDGSVGVIKQYADKITYWVSEPDKGIYNAMNKGIKVATGEYLQFLNSGDWLYSNIILDAVFKLNRIEDILYGSQIVHLGDVKILREYPEYIHLGHLYRFGLPHQATFIKRQMFAHEYYNEDYKFVADLEFLVKQFMINNCTSYKLDMIICNFDGRGISSIQEQNAKLEEKRIFEGIYHERMIAFFEESDELMSISAYPLYPYVEIFARFPKLQRLVKRFMKLILILTNHKDLIPKAPRE